MHKRKRVVIVGTGFGGVYTMRHLHKYCCEKRNLEIVVIGEKNYFLFTPLLHEVATGGVHASNLTEPIRKVFGCCLTKFHLGKVDFISTKEKFVRVHGKDIHYDYLVLAPGAETNYYGIPGAEDYSIPLKNLDHAIYMKNHTISQMEKAVEITDEETRKKMLRFVIVGGGPTGVELAGELAEFTKDSFAYYYSRGLMRDISIVLVQRSAELLPQFGHRLREKSLKILEDIGVKVMLSTGVAKMEKGKIFLTSGEIMETENVFWMAGVKPRQIKTDVELPKIADGRVKVHSTLQVEGHEDIFMLGDAAAFEIKENIYAPQLAQIAVRQAKAVAESIHLLSTNKKPVRYRYTHMGNLLSIGRWVGLGEIHHIAFSGKFTWWLWRTVYLFKIISWRKRFITAVDWTINLFLPRDISEI